MKPFIIRRKLNRWEHVYLTETGGWTEDPKAAATFEKRAGAYEHMRRFYNDYESRYFNAIRQWY